MPSNRQRISMRWCRPRAHSFVLDPTRPNHAAENGKTRFTARVLHWSVADLQAHEQMGLHQGWGQCAEQLEALIAKL
jgi:uncharacterized protein YndB with AHSA1/START domain